MKIPKKYVFPAGLALAGLGGGFLYWYYIGCTSGTCPITSNWHTTTAMGGLMGYLVGDSVNDLKKKKERDEGDVESAV